MKMMGLFRAVFALVVLAGLSPAWAFDIQEVTSPGGIKAYLVESHSIPLISMEFAFDGGGALDAPGKEGTAQFLTGLMDEGADDLNGEDFRRARDHISMKLQFDSGADRFYGSFSTLSKHADQAFDLLRKTITRPRLEGEPIERMRAYYLQNAEQTERDQNSIAGNQWMTIAFANHSYGRRLSGTAQSLQAITREDIATFHATAFSRDHLKIAVTGAIDAKTLGLALDRIFGTLPDTPVPHPASVTVLPDGPVTKIIDYDAPQTMFVFGGKGTRDDDPDDFANFLLCEILGGQAGFAILGTEVREKRGLTYGISYSAQGLPYAGFNVGGFSTANANAGTALKLVKDTLSAMAKDGPTEEQLRLAKSYLTGGYALRFDSNSAIANYLLSLQLRGLPRNYANMRNDLVMAVTRDQVKVAAQKYLQADKMIVVAVGKPEGMQP
jgi:zinc protease